MPLSILYDDTRIAVARIAVARIAVARICGDGQRERTRAFTGLVGHYLFRDRFGRPGKGSDKGKVEGLVKGAGQARPLQSASRDEIRPGATNGTPGVLLAHHLERLKPPTVPREYDKVARECAQGSWKRATSGVCCGCSANWLR